jgi:hypothetical protein
VQRRKYRLALTDRSASQKLDELRVIEAMDSRGRGTQLKLVARAGEQMEIRPRDHERSA